MTLLLLAGALDVDPQNTRPAAPQASAPAKRQTARKTQASLQTNRNLGKAYYEQGNYAEAAQQFQQVVGSGRALAGDYLNLGLAQIQLQDYDDALGSLTTARQMNPRLIAADYNLGLLYQRQLRFTAAEGAFQEVVTADPRDPAAWFNLGRVRLSQGKLESALEAYDRVLKLGFARAQNFYVVSLFHTFTVLNRLKRAEEAQEFLALHQQFRERVPSISLQAPALEAGKYGAVLISPPALVQPRKEIIKVVFEDLTGSLKIAAESGTAVAPASQEESDTLRAARKELAAKFGASLAVGDYDGDGQIDLYVSNPSERDRLLHNDGDENFSDVTQKLGAGNAAGSFSASFADYDNSGRRSLFVAGVGGVRLFHNRGDGRFEEKTLETGLKGSPDEIAVAAVLFDADNDGQLDLYVGVYADFSATSQNARPGPADEYPGGFSRFYRNNGDGTFTETTVAAGLGSARGRIRNAIFAELNEDPYPDLLILREDGPPLLYLNQGGASFVRKADAGFRRPAHDAGIADFNHDGRFDLVVWGPAGYKILLSKGEADFSPAAVLPQLTSSPERAIRGLIADVDGDSFDDLLAVDAENRWHFIANRGKRFEEGTLEIPAVAQLSHVQSSWLSKPEQPYLLGVTPGGSVVVLAQKSPRSGWLQVELKGSKSNQEGVGAVVEVKAGNFYRKLVARGGAVRVFTGQRKTVDVVRVSWPNAIVQNVTNVNTNRKVEIRESERLASSCPLLYVWDGEKYLFLTEVLGVAPLGALAPDGSYFTPNPRELVRLPASMQPRGSEYVFQFTDEMREVDYFDFVTLVAIDHPQQEEVYADESFSAVPRLPQLYGIRSRQAPLRATDTHGRDVLDLIREADGLNVADFARKRILGLADLHTLTLDLGPKASIDSVSLWLTGWVYWSDSNSARALMSNRTKVIGPALQVRDAGKRWVTVIPDIGLPSGTNRTMRVDLSGKFLSADRSVRIVTNLAVYWDHVFFTAEEEPVSLVVELPLASAHLQYRGFSTLVSSPSTAQADVYEYGRLETEAPWDPPKGWYTRYGSVETLVTGADDRLVVMAPGDELTVSFDARGLPAVQPGWRRSFFLRLEGWAKDGEPNTATGSSTDPMPFHSMTTYPYAPDSPRKDAEYLNYLREFQTRPGYTLIPRLAPLAPQN